MQKADRIGDGGEPGNTLVAAHNPAQMDTRRSEPAVWNQGTVEAGNQHMPY